MTSWLRENGWDPEPHESPLEALDSYARKKHPAVVVDWSLPGMDGLEVVRRLRSVNNSEQAYVLLVTAAEDAGLLQRAFEEGVDDFLRKPISKIEFLARMKAARRVCLLEEEIRRRSSEHLERNLHDAAMQRMSAVAGAVAHELRTPMGALRMAAERLHMKRDRLPDDLRKVGDRIEELSRVMAETMANVLDSFGIGTQVEFWAEIDFSQQVKAGVDQARSRLHQGVDLEVEVADCRGMGDGMALRRLVANLVGNALRATRTGKVQVRLSPSVEGIAVLEVNDTGSGIPSELLPWLGEAMLLNSENTKAGRYVQGNGIGLGLCRKIVAKHHGQFALRSSPGAGTRIRIELRTDRPSPASAEGPDAFFASPG
ncbi:MAG: hybrid sensor histidine kinase/response regulator [Fibrobacteria bacterium]|nr:hybrid sensor histidine kinase/response regulator [Fibrobacteria bacterium]